MPSLPSLGPKLPDEVLVAKLSIEAARIALESLFQKIDALPRSEKVIITDTVKDACARLSAAQQLLTQLETELPKITG
jgi:hypothetical protein